MSGLFILLQLVCAIPPQGNMYCSTEIIGKTKTLEQCQRLLSFVPVAEREGVACVQAKVE